MQSERLTGREILDSDWGHAGETVNGIRDRLSWESQGVFKADLSLQFAARPTVLLQRTIMFVSSELPSQYSPLSLAQTNASEAALLHERESQPDGTDWSSKAGREG